ncbi:MAG: hypothetical protein ACR2J5_17730 [Geodermatophilaceae bacterium]
MTNPTTLRPTLDAGLVGPPRDPVLREIGERVLAQNRAAALKAMASIVDPQRFGLPDASSTEALMHRRFLDKPAAFRAAAAQRAVDGGVNAALGARATQEAPDLRLLEPVAEQMRSRRGRLSITPAQVEAAAAGDFEAVSYEHIGIRSAGPGDIPSTLTRATNRPTTAHPVGIPRPTIPVKPKPKPKLHFPKPKPKLQIDTFTGVEMRLHWVNCKSDTDEISSDEISLAGVGTYGGGRAVKIPSFVVSNDMDAGETRFFGTNWIKGDFTPDPRTFVVFRDVDDTITMPNPKNLKLGWPRTYTATLLLVELDNGGFPEFVQKIFDKVKGEIADAVGAALGAAVGAAAGSVIPGIGEAVGALIGALVGWILGELWATFLGWWEDDEFPPITAATRRLSPLHTFESSNAPVTDRRVASWKFDTSHYELSYDWALLD